MNMTTVPSNQLKAMQQEIADLKETITQQAEAIRLKDAALVRKCAEPDGDFGIDNAIAFFHAAQRQAYERAAGICEAVADGWDKNPGRNPQAGYVASSNCATEIRALIVQNPSGA